MKTEKHIIYSASLKHALEGVAGKYNDEIAKCLLLAQDDASYLSPKQTNTHFSIRPEVEEISFLPKGKELKFNSNGSWSTSGRQVCKYGKFARNTIVQEKIEDIKDHWYSRFASRLKAYTTEDRYEFKFISFEDAYDNDVDDDSSIFEGVDCDFLSCMAGQPVKNFYSKFDAKVLAIYDNSKKKYLGRGIVWNNVQLNDGSTVTYLDRWYSCVVKSFEMVYAYARTNGWGYMASDGIQFPNQNKEYELSKKGYSGAMIVRCLNEKDSVKNNVGFFPYMDTFMYASPNFKSLSNRQCFKFNNLLRTTDGDYDSDEYGSDSKYVTERGEYLTYSNVIFLGEDEPAKAKPAKEAKKPLTNKA